MLYTNDDATSIADLLFGVLKMEEVANDGEACLDVLDHFLQDMHDLDMQQSMVDASERNNPPANCHKRRKANAMAAKPQKNPSWIRRKEELARLRLQTAEMENHVAFLRIVHQRDQQLPQEVTSSVRAWKTAAELEKRRREAAQQQNLALKSTLRGYVELSNTLQRAMDSESFQRQAASVLASTCVLDVDLRLLRQLEIGSPATFTMLERKLDLRMLSIDEIFNQLSQASMSTSSLDIQTLHEAGDFRAMEYKIGHILPFNEELTLNAAWSIVGVGGIPQKQLSQVRKRSENAFWIDSRFVSGAGNGEKVMIDTHVVVKRFLVPGGCVFLGEASSEWSAYRGNTDVWSVVSKESLWGIVGVCDQGTPGDGKSFRSSACQLKAWVRSEQQNSLPAASSAMPEFVVHSFQELVDSHRQFLENTLLDSVRAAGKPTTPSTVQSDKYSSLEL